MTSAKQPVERLAYQSSAFRIDRVDLTFELEESNTRVISRLVVERNAEHPLPEHIVLDGEAMVLEQVKIDGRPLHPADFELGDTSLTLPWHGDEAIIEITTRVNAEANTTLSGLYVSNGNFFTQCEAEGFRRITYYLDRPDVMAKFTTTIIADKTKWPVLLSNGNRVGEGQLDKNRHWVKWVDPFRKPCYLFALVAGRLALLSDTFQTASGRQVALELYAEPGDLDQCQHAMDSLKNAMRWDEERYGLEYDLDTYMIVATSDFNMGAMENKGLNIFNTKYVLAKPDTATDADFEGIESVVAHEYFHNWTGNRVTCRDWFQLSLKEGLTVYRDQEFSSDMGSRAVQRIQNVRGLREYQFAEDAGPQAHPVRPDSYLEINNFYTWTVYEKGSEVVRMYETLLGRDGFRRGMDLYFKRHDGQAVTCDDFRAAMADANDADLAQFALWYSQAGTPRVTVEGVFDASAHTYTLTVSQVCPPTPGQPDKQPMHIPLAVALLAPDGQRIPLRLSEDDKQVPLSRVLELRQPNQQWVFLGVDHPPVPSLLRDFSAPVTLDYAYTAAELTFLMAHDDDAFARSEAAARYATTLLTDAYRAQRAGQEVTIPEDYAAALNKLLTQPKIDPALVALMLELPSESTLFEKLDHVDPVALAEARTVVLRELALSLRGPLLETYQRLNDGAPYTLDGLAIGRRRLKNVCLAILSEREGPVVRELVINQYRKADNMTDRLAALRILANREQPQEWLDDFANRWQDDALVMDKWFTLQATSRLSGTRSRVETLMSHAAFSLKNPNKVRALVGAFCQQNLRHFHAEDGYGYAFAADRVIELDRINPQVAARLASCFNRWPRVDAHRQALMKGELERIQATPGLSNDTFEIVSKALAIA
ncbi:aminopeptidase N [Chitinibacteraceae bacterium HSL-7]